ncbi:hypothetical protein [Pseudoponticoccus marisrubri]|uniref:Uncharacterized protein n=1 Tax=Pseudoponticoccus marisrubri TaxID=1685382 RepID=A0A0W7WKB4_9RHOB|nr:hypothetical protein [Pseudoponticoccus marisrubri]KUF11001.1 hypothetical protein AVJ23_08045 [Pseudoponticoccus marisrubri]
MFAASLNWSLPAARAEPRDTPAPAPPPLPRGPLLVSDCASPLGGSTLLHLLMRPPNPEDP